MTSTTLDQVIPRRSIVPDRDWLRRNGAYAALGLLIAFNVVTTPNFLSGTNLRLQLVQVAPIVVVALGMALVIGSRGIDLSVGAVMALAAAVVPWYIGYGGLLAGVVALGVGVVAGLLTGALVAYAGLQPIVATLGVMVVGRGLAVVVGGNIKTLDDSQITALGSGSLMGIPYVVLIAALSAVVVVFLVRRTVYGRVLVAAGGNARAATLAGLPVKRVLVTTYVLCALLAAIAGVLVTARSTASDPTKIGLLVELSAITAVVLGGTPLAGGQVRILGTIAGALLLQLMTSTLIALDVPDSLTQMTQAAIVVAAVLLQNSGKDQ